MMNRATDKTLVEDMLSRHAFPQKTIKQASREILEIISEGLIKDGSVTISKFGSFRLKTVAERRGINPQTGTPLTIASHRRVIFTPCKALRELIEPTHLPPILLPPEEGSASFAVDSEAVMGTRATDHSGVPPAWQERAKECSEKVSPETRAIDELVKSSANEVLSVIPENFCVAVEAEQQDTSCDIDLGVFEHDIRAGKRHKVAWGIAAVLLLLACIAILVTFLAPLSSSISVVAAKSEPTPKATIQATRQVEGAPTKQAVMSRGANYFRERQHYVEHGDSLWKLAESYYHEPLLWPYIFKANSGSITNPNHIRTGSDITIPGLQGAPDNLTNSDQAHMAEAYHLLYDYYKVQHRANAVYAKLMARRYEKKIR